MSKKWEISQHVQIEINMYAYIYRYDYRLCKISQITSHDEHPDQLIL